MKVLSVVLVSFLLLFAVVLCAGCVDSSPQSTNIIPNEYYGQWSDSYYVESITIEKNNAYGNFHSSSHTTEIDVFDLSYEDGTLYLTEVGYILNPKGTEYSKYTISYYADEGREDYFNKYVYKGIKYCYSAKIVDGNLYLYGLNSYDEIEDCMVNYSVYFKT